MGTSLCRDASSYALISFDFASTLWTADREFCLQFHSLRRAKLEKFIKIVFEDWTDSLCAVRRCPLLRSLSEVQQTSICALRMKPLVDIAYLIRAPCGACERSHFPFDCKSFTSAQVVAMSLSRGSLCNNYQFTPTSRRLSVSSATVDNLRCGMFRSSLLPKGRQLAES